ncbi:hypothetical protein BS50DRAFT_608531 [Corynespora cassiicola Philippines]|uniref:Saponin hydrolase n=1 Tax=Corynespora cassiicola Philippines TaxID=1448308 RepID=A0A2T2NXE4_CORCC|nr:hypothetical protein BS50DRAFT_608531 [Corynespora cassiicola Philippines]
MSAKNIFSNIALLSLLGANRSLPPPPEPEPIEISRVPLPPTAPKYNKGSCSIEVNPQRTGCIPVGGMLQSGGFLPDNNHITAHVNFTGAPAAPDPASIYDGEQLIIIKVDGTNFSSGSAWKCLTCGVSKENAVGRQPNLDYPQAFHDGKKILAGANVVDCGDLDLASDECTADKIHIYPIRWNKTPDGSGVGGAVRELRLHPDNVHLAFSSFGLTEGQLTQYSYFSRLEFSPSPKTGEPLAPRYDLVNVTILHSDAQDQIDIRVNGSELHINRNFSSIGEIRGFSGSGNEITFVGYPTESSNIDVYAVDLTTGAMRRLTAHPEYCDPVDISPDDQWHVAMDTRGSDRQMFMAGMRYIPPVTDLISSSVTSSTRNNGPRRFFQPYLIDYYGDRGSYFGQQVNAAGDGSPGSINDPNWNGRADPRWSFDGNKIVYWQALVVSPSCGGSNPLPCPNSTEPGGATERIFIAHLTSRKPQEYKVVPPRSDEVPWATKYTPGDPMPQRAYPRQGVYTLRGLFSGTANVTITENANKTFIESVSVSYFNYSDVSSSVLNGWENITAERPSPTLPRLHWFSDLVQTDPKNGSVVSTKKTSEDGFHLQIDILVNWLEANGTLETTIGGRTYKQPQNGT